MAKVITTVAARDIAASMLPRLIVKSREINEKETQYILERHAHRTGITYAARFLVRIIHSK